MKQTFTQYYAMREAEHATNTPAMTALRQDKALIEQLYIRKGQPLGPGKALTWFEGVYTRWAERQGVRNILEERQTCMATGT